MSAAPTSASEKQSLPSRSRRADRLSIEGGHGFNGCQHVSQRDSQDKPSRMSNEDLKKDAFS